jgi:hypothetical protein
MSAASGAPPARSIGGALRLPQKKWGPALLPAPTAPSEGYAGVRSTLDPAPVNRLVTPLLDPGSPAQSSLSTERLPLSRSPTDLLDCAARRFADLSTFPARHSGTEVPRSQNHPVFRGPSWADPSRVPLRSPTVRRPSGTASRLRKTALPAPLPGWPRQEPESSSHCLPAEIGPLVTCRTHLPFPAPGEAGTAVPITQATCTPRPSRESEK